MICRIFDDALARQNTYQIASGLKNEKELEVLAFNDIDQYLMLTTKDVIQIREIGDLRKSIIKECTEGISSFQRRIEWLKIAKLRFCEMYTSDRFIRVEYIRQKIKQRQ